MESRKAIKNESTQKGQLNLNEYFGTESIERAAELYEKMQEPFIKGVELEIQHSLLSIWAKQLSEKTNDDKQKKYSFSEFVWFKLVEQLRNAGVGFNTLQKLREQILFPITLKGIITKLQQTKQYIDDLDLPSEKRKELLQLINSQEAKEISDEVTFTIFNVIIMECLLKKLPLAIAVFLDGTYIIVDRSKEYLYTEADKKKLLFETHTIVSIASILTKFLYSDLSGFVIPKIGLLSYAENKLFELMRTGEYTSILIKYKDKKMNALELNKSESVKEKIVDILNQNEFSEIIIKQHKGIVAKIESTKKITL